MEIDVFTRPDSPYWFAYLHENGKRKKVSLRMLAQGPGSVKRSVALKAAMDMQAKMEDGPGTKTLREAIDDYIVYLEAEGKPWVRNARAFRDKLLGLRPVARQKAGSRPAEFHLDPNMLVSQLKTQHMLRLVDARRSEGAAAQTIKHEIALLRSAVRRATARGGEIPRIAIDRAVDNPWAMPQVSQKTRYLTEEEWQLVYGALSPDRIIVRVRKASGKSYPPMKLTGQVRQLAQDAQDLMVALTMTGGRWSEVASLRWSKLGWTDGVANVWGGKVGKERLVPLPEQFQEVLRRRRAEWDGQNPYVFPSLKTRGDKLTAPSRAIRDAMNRVGLNSDPDTVKAHGKATVHTLRHTFASWLLQKGADLSAVQDMLGHASVTTTRRYAHLEKAKTAKLMGSILSNMGKPKDGS
jgi:integrase